MSEPLKPCPFVPVNTTSREFRSSPLGYRIQANGCWQWTGATNRCGYGRMRVGKNLQYAHREMYRRAKGPIPRGLTLDHLCRNTTCVNPAHLEAVPERVNILRGNSPSAQNARKTHCPKGHPYTLESAVIRGGKPARTCWSCQATRDNQRRKNTRATKEGT